MEESVLISPKIKEYNTKHKVIYISLKLEDKLNDAINEVLKSLPEDPFARLSNILKNVIVV